MYYDLTKEEYKDYEKKYRKTYVGSEQYKEVLSSLIVGIILWGIGGFIVGYNSTESFNVSLPEFLLFFVGGMVLIEGAMCNIQYKKELKKYIIEKSSKKK